MGGDLSIQGVVRDSSGNVAPDVYVTLGVFGGTRGWGRGVFGDEKVYTDETGFYSFNNVLRAEGGHYEVHFSGDHRYGKVYEGSAYWIGENRISGDVYVLNVTVHPVTGSAFSGVIQYEDADGSIKGFYSPPFIKPRPEHAIELVRGTPGNIEYPILGLGGTIGGRFGSVPDNTIKWSGLAGGTYYLRFNYRRSDGVLVWCLSPPFEIPPGETKQCEYTIRNCPPMGEEPAADAGGPYTANEGSSVLITASGSDPDGDPLTFAWDLDNDGTYERPGQSITFSVAGLDGPSRHSITVQVIDSNGLSVIDQATVTLLNVPPAVRGIIAPIDPVQVNTEISFSTDFSDLGVFDTHTALWDWGDGNTLDGTVVETDGSGSVTGSHTYTVPGVYTVRLTVTDDDGDSGESLFKYVVVYYPEIGNSN